MKIAIAIICSVVVSGCSSICVQPLTPIIGEKSVLTILLKKGEKKGYMCKAEIE